MPNYDQLIEQSQDNIKTLSDKLKDIDALYKDIHTLTKSAREIPEIFNKEFDEIVAVTEDYTNSLGGSTKKYLDGNNNLFVENLKGIKHEIGRLEDIDLQALFIELQKEFIDTTKADVKVELQKFENTSNNLQTQINEFEEQLVRLENVDLEKHFDKLQKSLSDIFGAINSINLTLIELTKNTTNLTKSVESIEPLISKNHQELIDTQSQHKKELDETLLKQNQNAEARTELLSAKLEEIEKDNESLKKEFKKSQILQISTLAIIVVVLTLMALK